MSCIAPSKESSLLWAVAAVKGEWSDSREDIRDAFVDCRDRVDFDAFDEVAMDASVVDLSVICASRIAMRLSWLISFDDIGCFRGSVGFLRVSCNGVFHAMVDDLEVFPVIDDAGVAASSMPGACVDLNFFARIVLMFLVKTVFGISGWVGR
jgi:hypothetical protein